LRLPSCKIYFFDLPPFCWRDRQKVKFFVDMTVNFADVAVDFCLPRQQKGGKSKK
jgi:hypothetical protein